MTTERVSQEGPGLRMGQGRWLGPYQLLVRLGAGGCGAVWSARHGETGAVHALKVVELPDAAAAARFVREAEAAARLGAHPHAVQVHASYVDSGLGVLVTEWVQGATDLQARLVQGAPLSLEQSLRVVREVGAALALAHARGVLHRDIKPANVLLDSQGKARLVDLGLARLVGERSLTHTGEVLGTPTYLAPEQALGLTTDERTDVFGLGGLLYACLTGQPPRPPGSLVSVLTQAATAPVPRLAAARPGLPTWVGDLVERATALAPPERFQSVAELLAALETEIVPVPGAPRIGLAVSIGLVSLVAAGIAWVSTRPGGTEPAATQEEPRPVHGGREDVRKLVERLSAATGPGPVGEAAKRLAQVASRLSAPARLELGPMVSPAYEEAKAELLERLLLERDDSTQSAGGLAELRAMARSFGLSDPSRDRFWDLERGATRWSDALARATREGDRPAIAQGQRLRAGLEGAGPFERSRVGRALEDVILAVGERVPSLEQLRFEAVRRQLLGFPSVAAVGSWGRLEGLGLHASLWQVRGVGDVLAADGGWTDLERAALADWRGVCPKSRALASLELMIDDAKASTDAANVVLDPTSDPDVGELPASSGEQLAAVVRCYERALKLLVSRGQRAEVERFARAWLASNPEAPLGSAFRVVKQLGAVIGLAEVEAGSTGDRSAELWSAHREIWRIASRSQLEVADEGRKADRSRFVAWCDVWLGEAYLRSGRVREARERLADALEYRGRERPEVWTHALLIRALAQAAEGQLAAARADLAKAGEEAPDWGEDGKGGRTPYRVAGWLYFAAALQLAALEGGEQRLAEEAHRLRREFREREGASEELDAALAAVRRSTFLGRR